MTQATKQYAVLIHKGKVRSVTQLRRMAGHNERTSDRPHASINPDATHLCRDVLHADAPLSRRLVADFEAHAADAEPARKNAVMAREIIFSASADFWKCVTPGYEREEDRKQAITEAKAARRLAQREGRPLPPIPVFEFDADQVADFSRRALAMAQERWGGNVLQMVLHLDEKSPHLHAIVATKQRKVVSKRGAVRAGEERGTREKVTWDNDLTFGGPRGLAKDQDLIAAAMAPLGLARGEKRGRVHAKDQNDERLDLLNAAAAEKTKAARQATQAKIDADAALKARTAAERDAHTAKSKRQIADATERQSKEILQIAQRDARAAAKERQEAAAAEQRAREMAAAALERMGTAEAHMGQAQERALAATMAEERLRVAQMGLGIERDQVAAERQAVGAERVAAMADAARVREEAERALAVAQGEADRAMADALAQAQSLIRLERQRAIEEGMATGLDEAVMGEIRRDGAHTQRMAIAGRALSAVRQALARDALTPEAEAGIGALERAATLTAKAQKVDPAGVERGIVRDAAAVLDGKADSGAQAVEQIRDYRRMKEDEEALAQVGGLRQWREVEPSLPAFASAAMAAGPDAERAEPSPSVRKAGEALRAIQAAVPLAPETTDRAVMAWLRRRWAKGEAGPAADLPMVERIRQRVSKAATAICQVVRAGLDRIVPRDRPLVAPQPDLFRRPAAAPYAGLDKAQVERDRRRAERAAAGLPMSQGADRGERI